MSDDIKYALRLARAFGGMTYADNNAAMGMSQGGNADRQGYQYGGMPMLGMMASNAAPTNPYGMANSTMMPNNNMGVPAPETSGNWNPGQLNPSQSGVDAMTNFTQTNAPVTSTPPISSTQTLMNPPSGAPLPQGTFFRANGGYIPRGSALPQGAFFREEGGSVAPYGVIEDNDKIILGSQHGEPIELSDDIKQRVQDIASKHGAWYEGDSKDIGPNESLLGKAGSYKGSWDEALAKNTEGYPLEYLAPMFSNVAVNKQHEAFESPKQSIFDSLLANQAKSRYFKDRDYDKETLSNFLKQGSEKNADLLKMANMPATKENLQKFFGTGEKLMWPDNWQEYPNNLGKIAKKFEDSRNEFLKDAGPGVYVTGAGHIPELKNTYRDLKVTGGERANYADGGLASEKDKDQGFGESAEFAPIPERPTIEQKFPQKEYPEFNVLPLKETNTGIHFDPNAGLAGPVTRGMQIARQAAPTWMGGEGRFDPNNPEDFRAAQDLAALAMTGSAAGTRPAGALASGPSREKQLYYGYNPETKKIHLGEHQLDLGSPDAAAFIPYGKTNQATNFYDRNQRKHYGRSDEAYLDELEARGVPKEIRPYIQAHFQGAKPGQMEAYYRETNPEAIHYSKLPKANGGVAHALSLTRGPHAIPLHQAIARHGYATDGAVEEKQEDNTSVAQQEDESREKFLQKELEGSAPQYNPSYDKAIKAAFQYTPPGAAMDAAGMLGNPSIRENLQTGRYIPAAMQAAAVAMPLGFAGRKAVTSGLKAGAQQLYKLGKPDVVGMPGYTAYKTVEDWAPTVVGQQAWNAAKDYGTQAAEAARQAIGFADGGYVRDEQGNLIPRNKQTQTPSSSPSSSSTTTPKTSRPISPEEYNKGNLKGGEYVMAKGGKVHPDVDAALKVAGRAHFRRGGMGYTLPPGIANNAKAMQEYINQNMQNMTDAQRLQVLGIAEAGNQKTDQARALPMLNVMNRAAAGFNEGGAGKMPEEQRTTIRGQMMAPRQFTSLTGQTPKNLQVGVNAINNVLHNPSNPQVKAANELVNRVASGEVKDFTGGSMYYATPGGAGRKFVQSLHHDKNVGDFGRAGAHVFAGNKELSPVAKINYPNVRDDLQRELAANRPALAAERTPQAAPSPATPAATTPTQAPIAPSTPQAQPFTPAPQAPVKAPDEASTQNFLKGAMAQEAPQAAAQQQQVSTPQNMGTPVPSEAPQAPEPTQMAGGQEEPIAKPMNPQGPEAPEVPAAQAEAPKMEAPEPVVQQEQPNVPDTQAQAAETSEDNSPFTFDFDQAADGGVIKPQYHSDDSELSKNLLNYALQLASGGEVFGKSRKKKLRKK